MMVMVVVVLCPNDGKVGSGAVIMMVMMVVKLS